MNSRENVFALLVTEDVGVIEYELEDVSNISKKIFLKIFFFLRIFNIISQ